jgi:serine/threonine protein phosphatase PrpC
MFDKSGSCAITCLFVDDVCYIANVGDSRALMSADGGNYTVDLSRTTNLMMIWNRNV